MNIKKIKISFLFSFFILLSFLLFPHSFLFAAPNLDDQEAAFVGAAGMEYSTSLADIIGMVIKAFLGLLGIIFVGLIVYAGYNWMTAAGESEKIETAKNTIKRAIIGLIITISAYSITYFVLSNLPAAGTQQTTVE